jgi:hypothetical protein
MRPPARSDGVERNVIPAKEIETMRSPGVFRTALAFWVLAAGSSVLWAGPGELDLRFGTRGWLDLSQFSEVTGAVALPDGSVVLTGSWWSWETSDLKVVRISASGATLWTTSLGQGYLSRPWRLQDGRILVGIYSDYGGFSGEIILLREDGTIDTGFGDQGRVRLDRGMVVTGAGTGRSGMAFKSIRELPDGNLLVSAEVSDDTIPTAWFPASLGVLFRISAEGRLLDPPPPALALMRERVPAYTELLPDGSGLVLATPGCCRDLGAVLLSRDVSGALTEAPGTLDGAWSLQALAYDGMRQRFYARGLWNSQPSLIALDANGAPDPSFGTDEAPRGVKMAPQTGPGEHLVDDGGALVAVSSPQPPTPENIFSIATSRAQLLIGRWDATGLADPRIDGANAVPLAVPVGRSEASVVSVVQADPGYAWVAASINGHHTNIARLARLQLGEGIGHGDIGFQISTTRIPEQGPPRTVRVVRSGGSSGAVSVRYETSVTTEGGLMPTFGTLSWADGDASSRVIEIQAQDDMLMEGEQGHTVRLLDATGGASIVNGRITVVIEDDETLAHLRVTPTSPLIVAGGTARFTLTLTPPAIGPVSVTALIGDAIDDNGVPLYKGQNNSGWTQQTVEWKAGQSGERVVDMWTNQNADTGYAADLYLRVITGSGVLLRSVPGNEAVGANVRVEGGPYPGVGSPMDPRVPRPLTPRPGGVGGGAMGMGLIALLGCLLIARRRAEHARAPAASNGVPPV